MNLPTTYFFTVVKIPSFSKSANLNINQAQTNLLMARSAFDLEIEIDL
jgi:hypothetical protein